MIGFKKVRGLMISALLNNLVICSQIKFNWKSFNPFNLSLINSKYKKSLKNLKINLQENL